MATTDENLITYDFVEEPEGDLYYQLLDYGLRFTSSFILVLRPGNEGLRPLGRQVLNDLGPHLSRLEQTDQWPGTRLFGHTAEVRWFEYNSSSAEIIKNATTRLYQWVAPDLPEDLCLMREDGTAWLTTIAHEKDAFLYIKPMDMELISAELPKLAAILRPSDGASS